MRQVARARNQVAVWPCVFVHAHFVRTVLHGIPARKHVSSSLFIVQFRGIAGNGSRRRRNQTSRMWRAFNAHGQKDADDARVCPTV